MTRYRLGTLVPNLRRYARLMTGEQVIADRVVLGALAAARPPMSGGLMYRLMLFRAVTGALAEASLSGRPRLTSIAMDEARTGPALAAAACALPFIERAVLGLVAVEEFSEGEAAAILKMPGELVSRCLASALDRLAPAPQVDAPREMSLA
ncbi:MAG: hypothetical protein ABL308_01600 [Oceanicaulis sp.]